MVVSFIIPEDLLDAELIVPLYWNSNKRIKVAGAYKTIEDRFKVSVDFTGIFVLVSK
jgi:hypothetical protein